MTNIHEQQSNPFVGIELDEEERLALVTKYRSYIGELAVRAAHADPDYEMLAFRANGGRFDQGYQRMPVDPLLLTRSTEGIQSHIAYRGTLDSHIDSIISALHGPDSDLYARHIATIHADNAAWEKQLFTELNTPDVQEKFTQLKLHYAEAYKRAEANGTQPIMELIRIAEEAGIPFEIIAIHDVDLNLTSSEANTALKPADRIEGQVYTQGPPAITGTEFCATVGSMSLFSNDEDVRRIGHSLIANSGYNVDLRPGVLEYFRIMQQLKQSGTPISNMLLTANYGLAAYGTKRHIADEIGVTEEFGADDPIDNVVGAGPTDMTGTKKPHAIYQIMFNSFKRNKLPVILMADDSASALRN